MLHVNRILERTLRNFIPGCVHRNLLETSIGSDVLYISTKPEKETETASYLSKSKETNTKLKNKCDCQKIYFKTTNKMLGENV